GPSEVSGQKRRRPAARRPRRARTGLSWPRSKPLPARQASAPGRICRSAPDRLEAATFRLAAVRGPAVRFRFARLPMSTTVQQAPGQLSGTVLFYKQPEPLSPEMHGKMGVKSMDGPFGFAKEGHAIPLTVGEFPLAAVTGPIIFVGDEKLPIAVMGLNAGENMFLRPDGLFEPGVYIPAYIRRYPFVFANDEQAQKMVLCIDRQAEFVVESNPDQPFFEADGQPSQYTKNCIDFCNNFEIERQRTMSFVELLKA